jgi:hypothetical protein
MAVMMVVMVIDIVMVMPAIVRPMRRMVVRSLGAIGQMIGRCD